MEIWEELPLDITEQIKEKLDLRIKKEIIESLDCFMPEYAIYSMINETLFHYLKRQSKNTSVHLSPYDDSNKGFEVWVSIMDEYEDDYSVRTPFLSLFDENCFGDTQEGKARLIADLEKAIELIKGY